MGSDDEMLMMLPSHCRIVDRSTNASQRPEAFSCASTHEPTTPLFAMRDRASSVLSAPDLDSSIDMNPGDESRTHVEWHRKGWSRSGLNAMRKASGSTVPTANDAADITLPLSQRRLFRSSCSSGVSAERPRTPNASGALPALARKHQLPARAQSVLGSSLPARPGTAASAACSIFSDSPQPQITGLGTHAIAATLVPRAK